MQKLPFTLAVACSELEQWHSGRAHVCMAQCGCLAQSHPRRISEGQTQTIGLQYAVDRYHPALTRWAFVVFIRLARALASAIGRIAALRGRCAANSHTC